MTYQTLLSAYKASQSTSSLCDGLKQRYGNDSQPLFYDHDRKKDVQDREFIRYIVNFIIEQAKHRIVISELPDVIQILHSEAINIIQGNPAITLEEAIAQVRAVGAMKFSFLKEWRQPISTEDFVAKVTHEVFIRLGSVITLDKIEYIGQYTNCATKQLLHAMPAIDVQKAAALIIEDISRYQFKTKR